MIEHRPERRARTIALIGLAFEVFLLSFLAILTAWSGSEALRALTLMAAAGLLIWLLLVLIYHQRVLVQDEAFESEQLRRERESGVGGGAIFDVDDEQLLLARRRLQWMIRWLLPVFTVLIILSLAIAALVGWSWGLTESIRSDTWKSIENTGLLIWFVGGAAFLAFLLSRYAVGMARYPEWRMLRAGASWLMGITLAGAALVITLAILHFAQTPLPEHVVAIVLRYLLLVLAAEIALNFVLDFYRPRTPGEEPRPAFDSRLLGLFSEPGGIARSIADAINYQFGFEVSSTWFYQLLQRSVVPLIAFAVFVLIAASSLVFIESNEIAVVERFGKRLPHALEPGLHVKYPWPVDVVYKVLASQVHELKIGLDNVAEGEAKGDELILWTNKHAQEPHLEVLLATPKLAEFINRGGAGSSATQPAAIIAGPAATRPAKALSASTQPAGETGGQAVAVSLMRLAVTIQYQIRDAAQWLATYEAPDAMIKTIADREIVRYCASVDVNGLIGGERNRIERDLRQAIQRAADEADLGVDLVFVGLQGVHPPEKCAEDFQEVVGAEQKKMASIRTAEAEYNKRLSEVAGSPERARELAPAIAELNRLEADRSTAEPVLAAARRKVNELFLGNQQAGIFPIGGKAAEVKERAKAERWEKENRAHAQAAAFSQEIIAKNAAPDVYRLRKTFEALAQAGSAIRKYVIAGGGTLQINVQDPMSAPLDTAVEEQKP